MDAGVSSKIAQLESHVNNLEEEISRVRNEVWFLNFEEVRSGIDVKNDKESVVSLSEVTRKLKKRRPIQYSTPFG